MTSKKVQPALIGVFVVLSCLLFIIGVIIFGGSKFFDRENIVIAYFEGSLKGLSIGAPVTYRGVTVGKVKEISIHIQNDEQNQHKVIIPVLIGLSGSSSIVVEGPGNGYDGHTDDFLKSMCEQGLRAKLKLQSLVTGQRYIDLAVYENSPAEYRDKEGKYLEIPTLPSETLQATRMLENINFEALYSRVSNILESLDSLTSNLDTTLDREKMEDLISDLSTSVASLNSVLNKVDNGVSPVLSKMDSSLGSIEELASHADRMVTSFDNSLSPLMDEMTATIAHFNKTMGEVEQLLNQVGKNLKPNSPLYFRLSEAMRQLEKTAGSIENLSDFLYRNPNALILGVQQTGDSGHDQ